MWIILKILFLSCDLDILESIDLVLSMESLGSFRWLLSSRPQKILGCLWAIGEHRQPFQQSQRYYFYSIRTYETFFKVPLARFLERYQALYSSLSIQIFKDHVALSVSFPSRCNPGGGGDVQGGFRETWVYKLLL